MGFWIFLLGAAGFSLVALFIVWVGYKVYLSIRRAEDKYENEKKNGASCIIKNVDVEN